MEGLSKILQDSEVTIIAVVIDKKLHKKRYLTPHHPYHLAMMLGLERIHHFLRIKGQQDKPAHIIFEARGAKEDDELELEFRRVCDGANRMSRALPHKIIIADKRTNSEGLQLADITARPIGLYVLRPGQANRALDVIHKKFFDGEYGHIAGNGLKVFPQ